MNEETRLTVPGVLVEHSRSPGVTLIERGHIFTLQMLTGNIQVEVAGTGAPVFEWTATASLLDTKCSCHDWIDYKGYEKGTLEEYDHEMGGDLHRFLSRVVNQSLVMDCGGLRKRKGVLYMHTSGGSLELLIPFSRGSPLQPAPWVSAAPDEL